MNIPNAKGFTLLELVITATVLLILASASVPLVKNGIRRDKELELSRNLREIRLAIDEYRKAAEFQKIKSPATENNLCPSTLEELVEGVAATGSASKKIKFLRRIPVDPFTGKAEWGLRSTSDDPQSRSWGGGHIYDVYSLAPCTGLNGIPYTYW